MSQLAQILGKSQKKHTMWSRIKGRDSISAMDLADSGFISVDAAEKFLSQLQRAGIIAVVPGQFVVNCQLTPMYRATGEGA